MDVSPTMVARVVIAMGAAAGWLMTGAGTQDAPDVRVSQPSVARPSAETMPPAKFTEVLRERMRQPVMPDSGRNPFTYGARHAAPRRDAAAPAAAPDMAPAVPIEPPSPVFKLSGIALTREGDATILTAIVIDNGTMVFAKTGDRLSNGYAVVRVDEMSITIVDPAGVTQTLRLP